jgi:hypothetical protein
MNKNIYVIEADKIELNQRDDNELYVFDPILWKKSKK